MINKKTLAALLIVALLVGIALIFLYYMTRPTVQSVTALIQRELPIGSSYDEVIGFLERHHMQGTYGMVYDPGEPDDQTVSGLINPSWRFFFIYGVVETRFKFSKARKLKSYVVTQEIGGVP